MKEKEHKEPSVTEKVTSYFNIFECGQNLLNQINLTYHLAFVATSAQDEYCKEITKSIIKVNIDGGKLCNEKIQLEVIDSRAELNLEHASNINTI